MYALKIKYTYNVRVIVEIWKKVVCSVKMRKKAFFLNNIWYELNPTLRELELFYEEIFTKINYIK